MDTNDTNALRLSISGMRRYAACGYAYKFHRDGLPQRITAPMWYGRLVHRIISRVYAGMAPTDAHEQVWAEECGSILPALEQWSHLHLAYLRSGKPNTKARAAWLVANPDYTALATELASYQADVLSLYRWSRTASVQELYARSRTLVREHGDELRVPGVVLVEGQLHAPLPEGSTFMPAALAPDDEGDGGYGLLQGTIGTTTVAGVPDVVAYLPERTCWRVGDYKTSRTVLSPEALREDAQLNLYLALLHQAGVIPAGARVEIGQISLSDSVHAMWVDVSGRLGRVPRRLTQQVEQTRTMIEGRLFMPVKGLLNGYADRCEECLLAHVCDV